MSGRRLTAILAADIAGYSALMGENEIDTVAALKGHQSVVLPMIAGYDGRVIDTAGDGILAEFSSVLNAVKCAVAIQETMLERNASVAPARRMQFRIGINQGDVLFDNDRIFGDGINVAARLEGLCEPGGICISGKVYEEIKSRFQIRYEDLGPQTLKNIDEPVQTYRISVSGAPAANTRQIAKSPLWGSRNRLIGAGAIVAVLCAGWLGWLAHTPSRIRQTRLVPQPEVQTAARSRQAVVSDSLPRDSAKTFEPQPFDGVWEFKATGSQNCPVKSFTARWRFEGGNIMSKEGQKLGSVANDGSFRFSYPSFASPDVTVESQGNLTGNTGQGSFFGVGTQCQGTFQIQLVRKF